jgi:RiboL-PSP-HEPN
MKVDDNALDIFEAASARSERMARLYHGMVNTRRRAMRSDWALKFEKLMNWNVNEANSRVDGHETIIVIREGSELESDDFLSENLKDLLRASMVMSVSAMDAYFHRKIRCYAIPLAKKGEGMPGALSKMQMSFDDFHCAMQRERKWGELGRIVEKKLGYQSLQSSKKIEDGLSLIGIAKFWDRVSVEMKYDKSILKSHLSSVVDRRNKIAHQGDLSVGKKTLGKTIDIKPSEVYWSIEFIKEIVEKSEAVINSQLQGM